MRNEWVDGLSMEEYAARWADMVPHIGHLTGLAADAHGVVEFGVRGGVSTWALLDGLPEDGWLYAVDIDPDVREMLPPRVINDPRLILVIGDDKRVELPGHADLVVIDSSHTYDDTVAELRLAEAMNPDRIALHDYLYGDCDDGVRDAVDEFIALGDWKMEVLHESKWGLAVLCPA